MTMKLITKEQYNKLLNVYAFAYNIYESALFCGVEDDEAWECAYELIFSDKCSSIVFEIVGNLDYYDPDTSYFEDTQAFMCAFKELMENIKVVDE